MPFNSEESSQHGVFVSKGVDNNNPGYSLHIQSNKLKGRLDSSDSGATVIFTSLTTINNLIWYHFVMVVNRTDGYGNITLYINGIKDISNNISSVGDLGVPIRDFRLFGSGSTAFLGTLDEVHVWNRSLTAGEINSMYNLTAVKYPIALQTRMGNNITDQTNWGAWGNTTSTNSDAYYNNATGQLGDLIMQKDNQATIFYIAEAKEFFRDIMINREKIDNSLETIYKRLKNLKGGNLKPIYSYIIGINTTGLEGEFFTDAIQTEFDYVQKSINKLPPILGGRVCILAYWDRTKTKFSLIFSNDFPK